MNAPCRPFYTWLLVASTSAKLEELSWPVQVGLQIKLKRSVEADVYSSLKLHKVYCQSIFKSALTTRDLSLRDT